MNLFFISLGFFGFFFVAMSIGVIIGNRRLKGSCGGLGNCALCENESEEKLEDSSSCFDPKQS